MARFDSVNAPAIARPTSSLGRAFEVLELLSVEHPLLRIEDVMARLGYTRSTAYRYVKELCDAGLLAPSSGGMYALGPRIVELERLLVMTDPLYLAGCQVLPAMRRPDSVLLLHNLYRDKVLCIYKEGPDTLEHKGERIPVRRSRGTAFPLFRGAASLAMLAFFRPHRIRQTYLRSAEEIAKAGLGRTWDEFRHTMAAIRRSGYATSRSQISPNLAGVAVPIFLPGEKKVIGSLARAFPGELLGSEIERECLHDLSAAADSIAQAFVEAGRDGAGSGR